MVGWINRAGEYFALGFINRGWKRIFSRPGMCFQDDVNHKLAECHPWTDHFQRQALFDMYTAFKQKKFDAMRMMAALGTKEKASKYCIQLGKRAIDFLAFGEVEIESFFLLE